MNGAEILIECLKREGVEVIFGYPGGQILPTFDKLYDAGVRFILTRHEQGAAHAADGYARSSGKPGVVLVTSGPGVLLTALSAMIGAATILTDPIFQGLAISLIFGILVSTLLTLVVIPVLYYAAYRRRYEK